jgi:hypothetical protein
MTDSAPNLILIDGASRYWRRLLGALPWAVLEELALVALPTQSGWTAPVGVRYVGAALAITKDTAARAIATLRSAGIVQPARVNRQDGPPRSGYLLTLPEGVTLGKRCPPNQDGARPGELACPNGEYTWRHEGEDTPSHEAGRACSEIANPCRAVPELLESSRRPRVQSPDSNSVQFTLFAEEDFIQLPTPVGGFEEVER